MTLRRRRRAEGRESVMYLQLEQMRGMRFAASVWRTSTALILTCTSPSSWKHLILLLPNPQTAADYKFICRDNSSET